MVTATQLVNERELSARLRKAADQGLPAALDSKKRSSTACYFEEGLRKKIQGLIFRFVTLGGRRVRELEFDDSTTRAGDAPGS